MIHLKKVKGQEAWAQVPGSEGDIRKAIIFGKDLGSAVQSFLSASQHEKEGTEDVQIISARRVGRNMFFMENAPEIVGAQPHPVEVWEIEVYCVT